MNIGGEIDVSMTLKSTISLVHTMVPVAATTGRVKKRVATIWYMMLWLEVECKRFDCGVIRVMRKF